MFAEAHPHAADVLALSSAELASPRLTAALRALVSDGKGERGRLIIVQPTESAPGDLTERLDLFASLHPGLMLQLGHGGPVFQQPNGLPGLLGRRLGGEAGRLPGVARFTATAPCEGGGELRAEVALQWLVEGDGHVLSVVNDEITPGHGTPLLGLVAGLSKALEEEGLDHDLLHYGMPALTRRRVLSGVAAVLKLSHPAPLYSSPARVALSSREALPLFEQLVHRKVRALCHETPGLIEALLSRALGMPIGKQVERRASLHAEG